ncbi:MAG: hypothetical protein ACI9MC_001045 [Kiritimatiellia bacterium]|jgi:hypothetical protein
MLRVMIMGLALSLSVPAAAGLLPIDANDALKAVQKGVGEVMVEGDVEVQLVKGKKRFDVPGEVPAGKYKIEAKFPGTQSHIKVGKVTVRKDFTTVLKCDANMQVCGV